MCWPEMIEADYLLLAIHQDNKELVGMLEDLEQFTIRFAYLCR